MSLILSLRLIHVMHALISQYQSLVKKGVMDNK